MDAIARIARQAARSILSRSGAWSDADYEDAEQEAAKDGIEL